MIDCWVTAVVEKPGRVGTFKAGWD